MELPQELMNMMAGAPAEETTPEVPVETKKKPLLRVEKDKRKGNVATLVTGYEEDSEEVRSLAKLLKQRLAIGGSTRDGEILLQGDVRQKTGQLLQTLGYKVKVI